MNTLHSKIYDFIALEQNLFTNVYLGVGYFYQDPTHFFALDYWALMGSMDISEDVWL